MIVLMATFSQVFSQSKLPICKLLFLVRIKLIIIVNCLQLLAFNSVMYVKLWNRRVEDVGRKTSEIMIMLDTFLSQG